MHSCENCRTFKITCFEKHLQKAASIRCYFDTINRKQSGFCVTYSFKIFVLKQKYKNYPKIISDQSQKIFYSSHIYNVYVIFYYEIPWFYQDFRSKNPCFLNPYSGHVARILNISLEIMLCLPK